jgi:hypothetical protein
VEALLMIRPAAGAGQAADSASSRASFDNASPTLKT